MRRRRCARPDSALETTLRIALISPWGETTMAFEGAVISTSIPLSEADGLLADFEPSPELLDFPRRKAWYWCEAQTERVRRLDQTLRPGWSRVIRRLSLSERLSHANPEERYRVPHITHWGELEVLGDSCEGRRIDGAVAIASNFGGGPWRRHPEIRLRNRLVTLPGVDLYGRRGKWRHFPAPWLGPPRSWKGELGGSWGGTEKYELLSKYRVAICLENTCEPYYFTEKFVDAVRAGCVPVYHAHPTVRETFLKGAVWVDPADYDFDGPRTLAAAHALDRRQVCEVNQEWGRSPAVTQTSGGEVFARIARIFLTS